MRCRLWPASLEPSGEKPCVNCHNGCRTGSCSRSSSITKNNLSVSLYLSQGPFYQSFTQRTLVKQTSQNWTMFFAPCAQLCLHYLLLLTQAESGSLRLNNQRFFSLSHGVGSTWEGQDTEPRQSSTPALPASGAVLAEPYKSVGFNCKSV